MFLLACLHRLGSLDSEDIEGVRNGVLRGGNECEAGVAHLGVDIVAEYLTLAVEDVEPLGDVAGVGRDDMWLEVLRGLLDHCR